MIRIQPILQKLETLGVESYQQPRYLSLALATKIAAKLPLPSSPVTSVESYFLSTYASVIRTVLDRFNEELIFPIEDTFRLIKDLFTLRYQFVFQTDTFALEDQLLTLVGCQQRSIGEVFEEVVTDPHRRSRLTLLGHAIEDAYDGTFQQLTV